MEKAITIAICDDEKTIRNEIADCLRNIVSSIVGLLNEKGRTIGPDHRTGP